MKSFKAVLKKDEKGVSVFCPELDLYTCGDTVADAKARFADLLIEYFEFLAGNRGKLSERFLEHLDIYKSAILGKGVQWDTSARTPLAKSSKC